jgi:hypothetical protein
VRTCGRSISRTGFGIRETAHRAHGYSGYTFIYSLQLARSACPIGFSRVSATSSLVPASRAGGFDEARGFATLLAWIRIFDELK